MNRDQLLRNLPQTRPRLLAEARRLEQTGASGQALQLLRGALDCGDDVLVRIELGRHLIDEGQPDRALRILNDVPNTEPHNGSVHLLRALAAMARRRPNRARLHLDDARRADVVPTTVQAWRAHIFDNAPRPPLPCFATSGTETESTSPSLRGDSSGDDAVDPTDLITFSDDDEQQLYGQDVEPTHLIELDDDVVDRNYGEEPEPTHLITFDDDEPQPREPDDESCPQLPGIQRGAAAAFGFDDDSLDSAFDESIKLDIDESALRGGIRVSEADAEASTEDPDTERSAIRHFTAVVRERAQSRIVETLQSPGRALLVAFVAAGFVLVVGFFSVYSLIAHAQLDEDIHQAERAIEADLYSSHLAALRNLKRVSDQRVLPVAPVDDIISAVVDRMPLLSTRAKKERAEQLERYVEARLDYRFVTPTSYLDPDFRPDSDAELLVAADVYRRLGRGDHHGAVKLAQEAFYSGADEDLAILANTDALAESGSRDALQLIADSTPRNSPAQIYSAARILYALGRDDDAIDLLGPLSDGDSSHLGARIRLAKHESDAHSSKKLAEELDDPNHAHASYREQARARVVAGDHAEDASTRRHHFRRAAELAPSDAEAVIPLVDFYLEMGDLAEARRLLVQTPSTAFPSPAFDVASARIDILEGEFERAADRLQKHAFDHMEATATLGVLRLREGDASDARALFDAVAERDNTKGIVLTAWLLAHVADYDETTELIDDVESPDLSPFFSAIYVETLRRAAGLASDRSTAQQLLEDATSLADTFPQGPEMRRQTCLIALEQRDQYAADKHCTRLIEIDIATPLALDAALRFTSYRGESVADILQEHTDRAGAHAGAEVLRARHLITRGELDEARLALDAIASRLHDDPGYRTAEGYLALARGRFDRAHRHFRRAEEATPLLEPEARLGRIHTQVLLHDSSDEDAPDPQELVEKLRILLRHGHLGPRAWTTFAALRRHQNRLSDTSENLEFGRRARADFGPNDELVDLLIEEATLKAQRHGAGDRRIEALLDELADLNAHHWRYHLLAARWHDRQGRRGSDRAQQHLEEALEVAADHCLLWKEKDDAGISVSTDVERPDRC